MTASIHTLTPATLPQTVQTFFSYDTLPVGEAAALRASASRIRSSLKITIAAIVDIGRDLISVKQKLDHGQFCNWVRAECGFTLRTAENYIRASQFAEDKSATVSFLQPSTVYKLSAKSTPPEIVQAVVARVEKGETISDRDVTEALDRARIEKDEADRKRKRADAQRSMSKRTRMSRDRREAEEKAAKEKREKTKLRGIADAKLIIEKLGPESLLIIAPAFDDAGDWDYYHSLRNHIKDEISKLPRPRTA